MKIIWIDEENDLLYENFPIAMNLYSKYENNYENPKYNYLETGFGGKLFIDKTIYDVFLKELKSFSDTNNIQTDITNNNGLDHMFVHSSWITIARKILQNRK